MSQPPPRDDAAHEAMVDRIRASGRRMTVQRRLVLDALRRAHHHVTAEDIAERIRKQLPQIDPSTVYRNLEALEALGYVTHTHFEDRVTRWHLADERRHGHLVCRSCGAELEVPMTLLEPLARRLRQQHGFEADLAHSAVVGVCRTCASVSSP
ncbi:MAG TPA: Fur family transcriptional regulator [Candidatus Limnocylindria bacterium]|nr:Fur family transcriptional regulator [Candidatus Limnocylindria bacterium]